MEATGTVQVQTVQALRVSEPSGRITDLAASLALEELLDLYQEALLGGELELANRLRLLIRGRLHQIETFSFGSSLTRQLLHGRRLTAPETYGGECL